MKDLYIAFTYHKTCFDVDEKPSTGTFTFHVEDSIAAELLSEDLSTPLVGHHTGISFHCVCEMILWYCTLRRWYVLGDDKILSIKLV